MHEPTAAEKIHTLCAQNTPAILTQTEIVDVSMHYLDRAGYLFVAIPVDAELEPGEAVCEITDISPLNLRQRVRNLAWLSGRLDVLAPETAHRIVQQIAEIFPHPELLGVGHELSLARIELSSVILGNGDGTHAVPIGHIRCASPDPFSNLEWDWLTHIDEDHPEVIERLCRHLPESEQRALHACAGNDFSIRPLSIDRYGLIVRIEDLHDRDVRIPFRCPVSTITQLQHEISQLTFF